MTAISARPAPAPAPETARRSAVGENPALHRLFSGVIALAAAFIAWMGLGYPRQIDERFTWANLPPLHARFVGTLYLFGAVYTLGGALSRHRRTVAPTMLGIALFTGAMGALTALNAEAFDWSLFPVRVWVVSYVAYPIISALIFLRYVRRDGAVVPGPAMPGWARRGLGAQAAAFVAVGVIGLVTRGALVSMWPWKVDRPLAQMYGGVFLALGVVTALHARGRALREAVWLGAASVALAVAALWASWRHRALFGAGDLRTWVWCAALTAVGALGAAVCVRSFSRRSAR
jgi:hypothetical protein